MTKTYTAYFYTDGNYASTEIEADTPEQALTAARKLDEEQSGELYYQHYDEGLPVNHIEILDEDRNELSFPAWATRLVQESPKRIVSM